MPHRRDSDLTAHAEEGTGNVALTCRYYGSEPASTAGLRRYQDDRFFGTVILHRRLISQAGAVPGGVVGLWRSGPRLRSLL